MKVPASLMRRMINDLCSKVNKWWVIGNGSQRLKGKKIFWQGSQNLFNIFLCLSSQARHEVRLLQSYWNTKARGTGQEKGSRIFLILLFPYTVKTSSEKNTENMKTWFLSKNLAKSPPRRSHLQTLPYPTCCSETRGHLNAMGIIGRFPALHNYSAPRVFGSQL